MDLAALDRSLAELPQAGQAFLDAYDDRVRAYAEGHPAIAAVFVVGSGPHYFSAREGTLKIEEQSGLVGKAYRTGDFHHDALSLLGPQRLVIVFAAAGSALPRLADAVRAAREAGSPTLAIEWGEARGLAPFADETWHLAGCSDELASPVLLTLPFQLLGYWLGVARRRNPDTLATDRLPNARAWLTSFPLGTH